MIDPTQAANSRFLHFKVTKLGIKRVLFDFTSVSLIFVYVLQLVEQTGNRFINVQFLNHH